MNETKHYQFGYSALHPEVTDPTTRLRKAKTANVVLAEHLGRSFEGLRVLDVGGSSGVMAEFFAARGAVATAIDIDGAAIAAAQARLTSAPVDYRIGDAMALEFADSSIDLVLCCHVYEHVPDAQQMMREIRRVLRPGGLCYFAAGNRFAWREPHYGLPLLSVIPRPLAHLYLRLTGKARYYHEKHLGYWNLKTLVHGFDRHDATADMINQPARYEISYQLTPDSLSHHIARNVIKFVPWLCPGYIWVLRKPQPT